MRRFWSFALAILILLTSVAAAEPLKTPVSATESDAKLSDYNSKRLKIAQVSSTATQEPEPVEPQQPALDILVPDAPVTQESDATSPADVQALLSLALDLLEAQDINLSWEDVSAESRTELTLHRTDAGALELLCTSDEDGDLRIAIDAEGVTVKADGTTMRYGYDELLEELAFELGLDELLMDVDVGGTTQEPLDILMSLVPSEEDEVFLMQLFEIAADELARAGLDFEPLETYDGAYLHLEFSPKLLSNAVVRFADRALEYEDEIDALLAHYDAPLRALFDFYDAELYAAPLNCAVIKSAWRYARQDLLCQWTDNAGATLEVYAGDDGTSRLNLQIRELLGGGSAVLLLDFDEDGNADGTLTLAQRDFGYGNAARVFDIDLSMVDSGMMLRVTPRTPREDFTLLTANLLFGYDGAAFDLTTDALRLRLNADSEVLAGSLELSDEFFADLNLAFGDELHGSLILSEDGYSYVLRLNG